MRTMIGGQKPLVHAMQVPETLTPGGLNNSGEVVSELWQVVDTFRVEVSGSGGAPEFEFKNNYFAEMCSGSEAGSYLRLIDCVYHSTLGLRVIKKKKQICADEDDGRRPNATCTRAAGARSPITWRSQYLWRSCC